MALSPLQRRVAQLLLHHPGVGHFALAGGAAMNVHDVIDRPTQDLDCFTTDHDGVEPFVPAAVEVLSRAGCEVTVERHDPGFAQLLVVDPATDERIGVDLGVDYRLSAPVATALGPVLDLDDLAADKTLALFARALPRDFLDVDALLPATRPSGSSSSPPRRTAASCRNTSPRPSGACAGCRQSSSPSPGTSTRPSSSAWSAGASTSSARAPAQVPTRTISWRLRTRAARWRAQGAIGREPS
ncbi:MAG: nucleotidyl transferase AbiEii/AbiGii toxin family protein [Actinomycetota bacterium]|nr:nucleotidyl transferase AbiEii/AbiGii toxin family protein [Actinomycetota bacterium]